MKSLLFDLTDKNILALGCGSGEEFELIQQFNPGYILGVDASSELLQICNNTYPNIETVNMNLEKGFELGKFDLVYSSLFIHYIENLNLLVKSIYESLNKRGSVILSTQHPASWGGIKDGHELQLGIRKDENGFLEPVGDYLNKYLKKVYILNNTLEISIWNRSIEQILNHFYK